MSEAPLRHYDVAEEFMYLKITPRYQWGGSLQGTVDTYSMTALGGGILADKPLLASADEITFSYDKTSSPPRTTFTRLCRT